MSVSGSPEEARSFAYRHLVDDLVREKDELKARLRVVLKERDEANAYAEEGWSWLSTALVALGVDNVFDIKAAGGKLLRAEEALLAMTDRAATEPIGTDVSDYGDEWCAGFMAGQVNALEEYHRAYFARGGQPQ